MPADAPPAASAPLRLEPLDNGLVYVNPGMPGFTRVRHGQAFRYRDAEGRWLRDAETMARIRQLAIPPAYTDVWICPLANGHLQAIGVDARGRKQYRYHDDWRVLKDETKFERLEDFARALPRIRARVLRDLQAPKTRGAALGRNRVLAALVRLLDTTYMRVGNETYANSNGSYGLTTLRNRHADVRGVALKLRFRGKSGVLHEALIDDPRVAKVVRQCQQLPGQSLFQYEDDEGMPHSLSSTDVNEYLREAAAATGTATLSAKDFRTWHGTVQALELTRLACENPEAGGSRYSAKDILGAVAKQLGNTPAVCKKAYVHPAVLALGTLLPREVDAVQAVCAKLAERAVPLRGLSAAEVRLMAFLRMQRRERAREAAAAKPQAARRARRTASRSTATS